MFYDYEPIKCTCQDCGKTFNKGDEGDNEKFCLRCERFSLTEGDSILAREYPLEEDFWDRNY